MLIEVFVMIVIGSTGARRIYTAKSLAEYIRRLESINVANRLLLRGFLMLLMNHYHLLFEEKVHMIYMINRHI